MKLVIVGGVAGGASAAARARRLSESAEIVLIERGPDVSFANCGLLIISVVRSYRAAVCWLPLPRDCANASAWMSEPVQRGIDRPCKSDDHHS